MSSRVEAVGRVLARYGLVVVMAWNGLMKFTTYEAEGIHPFVANSPLMSWLYGPLSVRCFSRPCWASSRARLRRSSPLTRSRLGLPVLRVSEDKDSARHLLRAGYPRTYTQSSFRAGMWHVLQSVV